MASSEIRFQWHDEYYVLYDASIIQSHQLLVKRDGEDWCILKPPPGIQSLLSTEEDKNEFNKRYEVFDDVKYELTGRTLSAMARLADASRGSMYLGLEENKRTIIDHFKLLIRESDSNLEECVKSGHFSYIDDVNEVGLPGYLYAQFYVPSLVFDDIEKLLTRSDHIIEIEINRKGWGRVGPIGDYDAFYTQDEQKAELAKISIAKHATDSSSIHARDRNVSLESKENQEMFLREILKKLESVKSAIWLIVIAVIFLAVKSWL